MRPDRSPSLANAAWGASLVIAFVGLLAAALVRERARSTDETGRIEARERLVTSGLDRAEQDFQALLRGVQDAGRAVASDPRVIEAFRSLADGDARAGDRLVAVATDLDLRPLQAVELYDATPRIRAWNGFAMPVDRGPGDPRFLAEPFLEIAFDGDRRAALVAWVPIVDRGRALGAVRAMRLVLARYPVRNEYLRDESLADDWRRATGLEVTVRLGSEASDADEAVASRTLRAPDGRVFATVGIVEPTLEAAATRVAGRYEAVVGFWVTLLVIAWLGATARWVLRGGGRAWAAAAAALVSAVGGRAALLLFDVPAAWQGGKAPLAPLFDPEHLASPWAFGLFASIGELVVTTLFALWLAVLFGARVLRGNPSAEHPARSLAPRALVAAAISAALFIFVEATAQRLLDDSTLGYFVRSGLLPQRLVVVVFASLLVLLFVALAVGSAAWKGLVGSPDLRSRKLAAVALAMASAPVWVVAYLLVPMRDPGLIIGLVLFTGVCAAAGLARREPGRRLAERLTARAVLSTVLLVALLLYPALDRGLEKERRDRMADGATAFFEETDPLVVYSVERALEDLSEDLGPGAGAADSVLTAGLRASFLASLGTFEVSAAWIGPDGATIGRSGPARTRGAQAALDARDRDDVDLLRAMAGPNGAGTPRVEKLTSPRERDRFDYVGLAGLGDRGWLLVRAAQHEHLPAGSTPFPRVLVPAGTYGTAYQDLSIAEFRDDVLVRSFGQEFGRSYLDAAVMADLSRLGAAWRTEEVGGREYLTYYVQRGRNGEGPGPERTVAVRQPSVSLFDRLYYLLRLTVSGLIVAVPVYLAGLVARRRAGLLPVARARFRDRVLDAFFAVGLAAVLAMGALGLRVVTGENERAIESWLRQHLERVEETLVQDSGVDELPYRALERVEIDSLAARVGLDLTVYRGFELESSSRPQLARDRLIPTRLPIEAYRALFVDGFRFVDVEERLGNFRYTAGYRALTDEQGVPRYVVSVPTLPEQERIEEERARTVAYLFGALLLLVLAVMATAAVIANALTRPLVRLRTGLERVAEGRYERIRPLDTRDELGDLVSTFNLMQDQLAESRRLLAAQERQLAWREMARQVAHEIKNSLTPMKLTIQHLRRAWERDPGGASFPDLFERKTSTLLDQSEALVRIANEFSTFARMPLPTLEVLDLNRVASSAVLLMQEQSGIPIELDLAEEPLDVEGDREALQRVFINFIKNAVEALESRADGTIRVVTRADLDPETGLATALARVVDDGPGVAPEVRDRIFVPAFSTKTSGTGLGLAIARSTVEELRGSIGFETETGQGSTFWFRLPLIPADRDS